MKRLTLFLCVLFIAFSCRSKKNLAAIGAYDSMNMEQIIDLLNERKSNWPSYSGKIHIHYEDKYSTLNVSARFKILRDKAIWVSISPGLGIEAVRALITPDSLKLLNRIEKTYYVGGYEKTESVFNTKMDFEMIQSLFYGAPLYRPTENYVKGIENEQIVLRTHPVYPIEPSEDDSIFIELRNDSKGFKLEQQWIADLILGGELNIRNLAFEEFEGSLLAVETKTSFMDSIQTIIIDWTLSGMKTDDNPSIPFKIPSKYVPMP